MNAPLAAETISSWEPGSDFEKIAVTIGHHFWKCHSDRTAYEAGRDAASKVMNVLDIPWKT